LNAEGHRHVVLVNSPDELLKAKLLVETGSVAKALSRAGIAIKRVGECTGTMLFRMAYIANAAVGMNPEFED
jgi:hypothetical protein